METSLLACNQAPRSSTLYATELADLAEIYAAHLNVAVFRRGADAAVQSLVRDHLLERDWEQTLRIDTRGPETFAVAPWCAADTRALHSELVFLVEVYGDLFGANRIGLRLSCGIEPPCPRFHVDRVGVRMVCTYLGRGTEWLDQSSAKRRHLGHAAQGQSDELSGLIQGPVRGAKAFDLVLLKGEAWPENEQRGAVHRSPPSTGQRRLFVTLESI